MSVRTPLEVVALVPGPGCRVGIIGYGPVWGVCHQAERLGYLRPLYPKYGPYRPLNGSLWEVTETGWRALDAATSPN